MEDRSSDLYFCDEMLVLTYRVLTCAETPANVNQCEINYYTEILESL